MPFTKTCACGYVSTFPDSAAWSNRRCEACHRSIFLMSPTPDPPANPSPPDPAPSPTRERGSEPPKSSPTRPSVVYTSDLVDALIVDRLERIRGRQELYEEWLRDNPFD